MLKRLIPTNYRVRLSEASFPSPFESGLEYCCPARGVWNIVHTGMLLPQAHEIFVCAAGCLRGVVLTAAEMNAQERFSTVEIRENNVLDGDMEELIFDGVSDILLSLDKKPPAVLLYTSCIHHFMGCDLPLVYKRLRERFPDIAFADCYMNPIMRKSGLSPDRLMRKQLYSLLEKRPLDARSVNIIGSDLPTDESSELVRMIRESGYILRDITQCRSFEEYMRMSESAANISYYPPAKPAGDALEKRLGQKHLYLPLSYSYDEIAENLSALAEYLGAEKPDFADLAQQCDAALDSLKSFVNGVGLVIDYTFTPRPLGLARLLLDKGFRVTTVFLDSIESEERGDFDYLKKTYSSLELCATVRPEMLFGKDNSGGKILALGQKAAYFTDTQYFVNLVEGGGLYGFDGILRLCGLMREALEKPKNTEKLIQIKGLGCGCV